MIRSAAANDGLRLRISVAVRGPSSTTSFRSRAAPCHVIHAPDPSEIDTQSDTLRSGRPCDSWTSLDAKVRDFLSKMHRWTPPDAGGTAGTDLPVTRRSSQSPRPGPALRRASIQRRTLRAGHPTRPGDMRTARGNRPALTRRHRVVRLMSSLFATSRRDQIWSRVSSSGMPVAPLKAAADTHGTACSRSPPSPAQAL